MEKVQLSIKELNLQFVNLWLRHVIFSWQWCLLLILSVLPWVIWINIRKKESTDRLLYAAFFVMLISSFLDLLGIQLGFWAYHFNVIPLYPAFIPWDITLLPVFVMAILQYKPHISSYLKALLFALVCAFVFEPTFEYLGIYNIKMWKHHYSLPLYIIIYLIANHIAKRNSFKSLN